MPDPVGLTSSFIWRGVYYAPPAWPAPARPSRMAKTDLASRTAVNGWDDRSLAGVEASYARFEPKSTERVCARRMEYQLIWSTRIEANAVVRIKDV